MANNNSGKSLTLAMAAIVVVVLALGAYAVVPRLSENIENNRIASGDIRVSDQADYIGMEVDEFLSYYGVAEDGLNEDSSIVELMEKLTFGKYVEFMYGKELTEEELAEFKTANSYGDEVTVDTEDSDVKAAYDTYYQQKQAEEQAAAEAAAAAETEVTAEAETTAE